MIDAGTVSRLRVLGGRVKLYEYQKTGVDFLSSRRRAYLADDMGLGKSAQAIRACDVAGFRKPLVVCPASVTENWKREFSLWSERRTVPVVVSFDMLVRRFPDYQRGGFSNLIVDEAHFLKNPQAKRTVAVLGTGGVAHQTKATWLLSGTPAPNHAAELWTWLRTFGATIMSYDQFVARFCHSYEFKPHVYQIAGTKTERIGELKAMLAPYLLRRKKSEVLTELPPISFNDIAVTRRAFLHHHLTLEIHKEMERIEHLIDGESDLTDDEIIRLLEMTAQSVSSLRRYCGFSKVRGVAELIKDELSSGAYQKVVLFAVHRGVIEALSDSLSEFSPAVITGATPTGVRQSLVDRFQTDPASKVFIGNIQAAGTGLTLTAASQVLFVEQEWVPGHNAQAAMRCHRIGQKDPVFVRFASLSGTVDQKIAAALARKTRELSEIFD